jgi:hypothetical protein
MPENSHSSEQRTLNYLKILDTKSDKHHDLPQVAEPNQAKS